MCLDREQNGKTENPKFCSVEIPVEVNYYTDRSSTAIVYDRVVTEFLIRTMIFRQKPVHVF